MSTIIFHPSVAPFVQQAARALHEAGLLHRFHTTLRYQPEKTWQRAAIKLARLARYDLERQLRRRSVNELPPSLVASRPVSELIRLLSTHVDSSQRIGDLVWEWAETGFDRHVARRGLTPEVTAVYGYEHSSLATFQRARETGRRVIYDVPAPEPGYVQAMLERELAAFPELQTPFYKHTFAREERRAARRHAEWDAADLVVAASRYTRDTFTQAGRDPSKVTIIPYGAPPPAARDRALAGGSRPDGKLEILWAGTFGIRKGAHYLLDAWRRGNLGRHARLRVFGAIVLPDSLLHPLPPGVELGGSIPRDILMERYRESDVLMFPTLCDGFGMVATEAWSQGVPVITSDRAGCTDLLRERENGLLVKAGDADALIEIIEWSLSHRAELRAMREASLATAAAWQWSDYRAALGAAVSKIQTPA